MTSLPETHSNPFCGECGKKFATVEDMGDHVDKVHRQERVDETAQENPTNIGPGITEQHKDA